MPSDNSVSAASVSGEKLNKRIAVFIMFFSAVEAVLTFLLVLFPLYIQPIYHNAYLDEKEISYTVSFFGKIFSENSADSGTIVFSSAAAYLNILLILLLSEGIPAALSVFFRKGYAFAKKAVGGIFGLKCIIGLMPVLIPLNNVDFSIKLFGVIDSAFCFLICSVIVYLNSLEYADEMRFNGDNIRSCRYRAALYGILFLMFTALAIFESGAMSGYGINWSIYLGKDDQELYQGLALTVILAAALFCSSMYSRTSKLPLCFFASFGSAAAVTNIIALINKIIWCNTVYKEHKAAALSGDEAEIMWLHQNGMTTTWWLKTAFIFICALLGGAAAYFAFVHLSGTLKSFLSENQIKTKIITLCLCGGTALLFFTSTIIAVTLWDKRIYNEFVLGAMDYMYFILFGGLIIFSVLGLLCGHSGVKWILLSIYVVFGAENLGSIFMVLREKRRLTAQYTGYVGYDFIASAVWFGVSLICAFTILILFCSKSIDDFLYRIRTAELESEAVWYDAKRDRAKVDRTLSKEEHSERRGERAVRRSELKKISDAMKAEKAVNHAEIKKINNAWKSEIAARNAEVKKITDAQKAEKAVRRAEVKKVTDAQKAERAVRNAEVKKVTDAQKAENAVRNAEIKKISDAQKAERAVRRAEVKKIADAQKAERNEQRIEAKKVTDAQKIERERLRAEYKEAVDAQKAEIAALKNETKNGTEPQKAKNDVQLEEIKKVSDAHKAKRDSMRAEAKKVTDAQKTVKAELRAKAKKISDAHKAEMNVQRAETKKLTDAHKAVMDEQRAITKKMTDAHKAVMDEQRAETKKMTDAHKAVMDEQRAKTKKMTDAHKAVMNEQRAETQKMTDAHNAERNFQYAKTRKMIEVHNTAVAAHDCITNSKLEALNEEKTALRYKAKREMGVLKTIQASRRAEAMKAAKEREMKNWEAAKNG